MNSELIIEGEKIVTIKRIKQWHTYASVLEGRPNSRVNREFISEAEEDAKKFCELNEIYVIEPVLTPNYFEGKYRLTEAIALPAMTCIAELLWYPLSFRDASEDCSCLGLVWFQEDYAFPIDNDILEKIKQIPFSKLCGNFSI